MCPSVLNFSGRFSNHSNHQEQWIKQLSTGSSPEQDVETTPINQSKKLWQTKTILIFLICSCAIIMANIAVGAFPVLLPLEVMRKDYRLAWIGILFLVYGLVVFAVELLQFKIVPVIGVKRTFVLTSVLLGVCNICFGMLDFTDSGIVFGVVGCLIRCVEAFCYAGVMNSGMTLLCLTVPNKAIMAVGLIDALVGFGLALGPLISGALYAAIDFTLPLALFGIVLIIIGIWGQFRLEPVAGYLGQPDFSFLRLLYTDLAFVSSAVVVFAMGIVSGFIEATLEVYLAKFGQGTVVEGAIFFAAWTAAAISSPIWGWILKTTGQDLLFLLLGPLLEALVFIVFGPFPGLESISLMLGLSIVCLLIITVTTSMSLMAAIDIMLRQAERYGFANDTVTYAFVSAIWLSMLYLGEGIGGVISGTVLDIKKNYSAVAVALFATEIILGFVAAGIMYISWRRRNISGFNAIAVNMNQTSFDSSNLVNMRSSYDAMPESN